MATIGTFHKQTDGTYTGSIITLAVQAKQVTFRPADKDTGNEKAPDFRIFAGKVEFGAAWKKTSGAGRDYLSVKLDDPSFAAAIHTNLVDAEDGFNLIWSRSRSAD